MNTWTTLDRALQPTTAVSAPGGDGDAGSREPVERRDFLKLAGIGAAASLAACQRLPVTHAIPHLVPPEGLTPGSSLRYASTCSACPASCGLVAVVRDGRPVKLEGRAEHPLSRGGLCAVGQADLRALYDPARLRGPKLDGAEASWDALDERVRSGLASVRERGLGVALLTPSVVGPTARRVLSRFADRFEARWVELDPGPGSSSATLEAYAALTGEPLVPFPELARTDLLVVLGGDPLGAGPDPVGFAAARAERRRRGTPFRHVQVEGCLSLSGAAADERWIATAAERRQAALWLLRRVAEASGGPEAAAVLAALGSPSRPEGTLGSHLEHLVDSLLRQRPRSLVMSGDDDLSQATAVALINRLLGAEGVSLDVARPALSRRGMNAPLHSLLEATRAGELGALFVLGVDPVDQLAEGAELADALRALPLAVAVTDRPTATAGACAVVAAAHHGLESWGDYEPRAGVLTLAQPAIRPLFDTRHAMESFLAWERGTGTPVDYREELRARWLAEVLAAPSEAAWRAAVAAGGAPATPPPGSAPEPVRAALDGAVLAQALAPNPAVPAEAGGLEAELIAEVARREGSRAHVPWLQELPDPLTRVSWTACLRIAPALAESSGLRDGDVARLEVGDVAVTMPVLIVPGQHPRVVGVPLGYGRHDGDASRPETNAYRLQGPGGSGRQGLPARLTATGEQVALPLVQGHPTAEGRPIVHQVHARDEAPHGAHHAGTRSLWEKREVRSPRWHMAIDLDACTGCSACVVACQAENNIPVVGADEMRRNRGLHWLRIDRYFAGEAEAPDVLFEPMLCAQCDNAPCETVCPVAATVHSDDGLNQQVYNRCVGTRYCANNCPYKVRAFNWFAPDVGEPLERMVLNPDVVVRARGVMEKCSFCIQRIQAARIEARAGGHDQLGEVQTACQESCPARAISFGDATDPESRVARERHEPRAFRVLEELGIEPSVTYLARVRARGGEEGEERS